MVYSLMEDINPDQKKKRQPCITMINWVSDYDCPTKRNTDSPCSASVSGATEIKNL